MRDQIIPDPLLYIDIMMTRGRESMISKKGLKIQNSQEDLANLNMGRVAGYYYNTHARVAFKDQIINQALEDETNLLNQKIQNYN